MRAVTYDSYSKDDSRLTVGEVDDPKVGPGTVLIEVRAAGVNPVDWKVMAGGLDPMMDTVFPAIPGWDVAGVVRAVGPDTPEFEPGDEVMSYARKDIVHAGTFAEQVAVSAAHVARKPAGLSFEQAAGLPLAGLTALRTLDHLAVRDGETLLVLGASGGVGAFAVQLARARGARVIGTASGRNHDYLRELGAEPVDYKDDVVRRVRELAPGGVDAVADFVGGQLDVTVKVLAEGGRNASTADPSVREHGGTWVWVRPDGERLAGLGELAEQGRLTVEVAGTFPLERVGDAFEQSRSGHTRGKLVIVP
ncbi:NADP-dependent oxidoreductase [Actinomadura macrotermitis]|uniref:Narbonolide/10-deoxymethynolide synthase PikA2, modules 3 and 4 n=1 Tax=Actinomadura macrotermitis TaxID=2585200 RepID=A0A7K0BQ91_9ACTN|nr:NADP-dependent oxidoreductase [Actinomadura macrotermitis]MQY03333.1 Narbonolide/10-deoxymethynolide synthase PikA2, modules 3 and 4 [Actinomadura macrotermitis]